MEVLGGGEEERYVGDGGVGEGPDVVFEDWSGASWLRGR